MSSRIALSAFAVAALIGGACYEDDSSGPATSKPMAKVLLTDAPFPFDTVASVDVFVVSIAASTEPDTGGSADNMTWVTITEPRRRINLLTLQQGVTALLGEGELPAAQYRAIRVIIDTDQSGIRFKGGGGAVVHWGGAGQQAIHAFVEAAMAVPSEGADIVIDFDVGRSFQYNNLGDGAFNFFPWIRAVNRAATGSIGGTIHADSTPLENAVVSASGLTEGTWQVRSTGTTDADGRYRLAYLLPGTYVVHVYRSRSSFVGHLDSSVVVTTGRETEHDVDLSTFPAYLEIFGSYVVFVGGTNKLTAQVLDGAYEIVPDPVVTWTTLDTAVFAVTDSGRAGRFAWVTGRAVGTGQLTATSGEVSKTHTIYVVADTSSGGSARALRLQRPR